MIHETLTQLHSPPAILIAVCDRSSRLEQKPCVSSCTFREDSAATRSVQSSGRSLRMSTALTQPEHTMVTPTCSLNLGGKMTATVDTVFFCVNVFHCAILLLL